MHIPYPSGQITLNNLVQRYNLFIKIQFICQSKRMLLIKQNIIVNYLE